MTALRFEFIKKPNNSWCVGRQTDRGGERHRQRWGETDRQRRGEWDRHRRAERDRQRETHTRRDRNNARLSKTLRKTDTHIDRGRDR